MATDFRFSWLFFFRVFLLTQHLAIALILFGETLYRFSEIENQELKNKATIFFCGLTPWNITIQCLYLAFALAIDFFKPKFEKHLLERLTSLQGYVYTTFVVPFTIETSALFWAFYFVKYDAILPEWLAQELFPVWRMFCLHGNNVLLLVEVERASLPLPKFESAFLGANLIMVAYGTVFYATYFFSGVWFYSLFDTINWSQRISFTIFLYILQIFLLCVSYYYAVKSRERKSAKKLN